MTRTIVIELAGEEDILVTKKKKEAGTVEKREEWRAPELGLVEVTYDEVHQGMPEAFRDLFEEYFKGGRRG